MKNVLTLAIILLAPPGRLPAAGHLKIIVWK